MDGIADQNNPTITLVRGGIYKFNLTLSADPFWIKTSPVTGLGSGYGGIAGNGASSGTITFQVPMNAPAILYYQSQTTALMGGTIHIVDSSSIFNDNGNASVQATTTLALGDIVKIFASFEFTILCSASWISE